MAQAVNGRPVTLDIPARSRDNTDGIYGEQSVTAISLTFDYCSFSLPVSFRQSSIIFLVLKLPLSEARACCVLRGDDYDRPYLGFCSIRAWTRLRCLEGTRESWRLCIVTSTDFRWYSLIVNSCYTPAVVVLLPSYCVVLCIFCVVLCIFVFYVLFVLWLSLYCLRVHVYWTTATGWLPNCS